MLIYVIMNILLLLDFFFLIILIWALFNIFYYFNKQFLFYMFTNILNINRSSLPMLAGFHSVSFQPSSAS